MTKNTKKIFKIIKEIDEPKYYKYNDFINELYKEQYSYFYTVAFSILSNESDTEDTIQEVFIKIYKNVEKIFEKKRPEMIAYCVNIVKNTSIDLKRKQKRLVLSEYSEQIMDKIVASDYTFEEVEKILENEKLDILLEVLEEKEKEILELRVIDRLSFKEIAKEVGGSEECIKKKYYRIVKKLQDKERRL